MFKTTFSGHDTILGGTKIFGGHYPRMSPRGYGFSRRPDAVGHSFFQGHAIKAWSVLGFESVMTTGAQTLSLHHAQILAGLNTRTAETDCNLTIPPEILWSAPQALMHMRTLSFTSSPYRTKPTQQQRFGWILEKINKLSRGTRLDNKNAATRVHSVTVLHQFLLCPAENVLL